MSSLTPQNLTEWTSKVQQDPALSLATTVISNADAAEVLIQRDPKAFFLRDVFNTSVEPAGAPITNQKASGRCWLFAATNTLRVDVQRRYNLDKFQLSPSYLYFYDKLEKANFFLEQIIDTAKEPVDGRLVQHLLSDPVNDGGQFNMVVNIVEKYGLVPNSIYPDNAQTLKSAGVNQFVTTLLRQYAQELREAIAKGQDPRPLQKKQIQHIHQLLVVFLGAPPGANDEFTWDYVDKDKKAHSLKSTPLKFYKEVVKFDATQAVSLLNDPRNEYNRVVQVDRLGNVHGEEDVKYLNVEIDVLADKAIERIKAGKPVFFGTHTPIYHDKKSGIIDTNLWNYKAIGFDPKQDKASRIEYHQSLMTHAMTFTAVHLDENGKPVRWKVENSWGKDVGNEGFFVLSHDFFKEYVYQVVVEQSEIPDHAKYLKTDPVHLPPWDPMGALADN